MASSENFASTESWLSRSNFADSWFSEAYPRDIEILTKALQKSMSNNMNSSNNLGIFTPDSTSLLFDGVMMPDSTAPTTPTESNVSGSDPEGNSQSNVINQSITIPISPEMGRRGLMEKSPEMGNVGLAGGSRWSWEVVRPCWRKPKLGGGSTAGEGFVGAGGRFCSRELEKSVT